MDSVRLVSDAFWDAGKRTKGLRASPAKEEVDGDADCDGKASEHAADDAA